MIRTVWIGFAMALASCAGQPAGYYSPGILDQEAVHAITPRQIVSNVFLATYRRSSGKGADSLYVFKDASEIRHLRKFVEKEMYDAILDFARASKHATAISAELSNNDQIWLGKYGEGNVFIECITLPEAIQIDERPTSEGQDIILKGRYERDPGRFHSIESTFQFVKIGELWRLRDVDNQSHEIGGPFSQLSSSPSSLKRFLREATVQIRRMKPVPAESRD